MPDQECRSEEGVTVSLVDGIIAFLRVLAPRDLSPQHAQEALQDLSQDHDLRAVLDSIICPDGDNCAKLFCRYHNE